MFIGELIPALVIAGIVVFILAVFTVILGGINRAVKAKKIRWLRWVTISFTLLFILTLLTALGTRRDGRDSSAIATVVGKNLPP